MSDQSGNCTGPHQKCSENVRCPSVISCSAHAWKYITAWNFTNYSYGVRTRLLVYKTSSSTKMDVDMT